MRGIGAIPDQGFGGDVDLAGPRHRIAIDEGGLEQLATQPDWLEDSAPHKVVDVAIDNLSIGQRQPKPIPVANLNCGNTDHDQILAKRLDRKKGLTQAGSLPVGTQLGPMGGSPFDHQAEYPSREIPRHDAKALNLDRRSVLSVASVEVRRPMFLVEHAVTVR